MILSWYFLFFAIECLASCHGSEHPARAKRSLIATASSGTSKQFVLPSNLIPTFYNLTIQPFLEESLFKGTVRIAIDVISETDSIILNVNNETIFASEMKSHVASNVQGLDILETVVDDDLEIVTFKLNDTLKKQKGVILTVFYKAVLNTIDTSDDKGFYTSSDDLGETQQKLAITQFQPADARRAFPCFDDPKYRTPFQLTMYRKPGQVSLFNMPLMTSFKTREKTWIMDVFEPTPPIPSYLVGFGVTDMDSKSDGGQVRLFADKSVISDMKFALSQAQAVLDALGKYTGVTYAFPKMDMIAVFHKGGAMENCGLVTFGVPTLRAPEASPRQMFDVLSIIAHEFGHQWFGGLVTTHSWESLWLNEAFATFFEYTIPNLMHPEWNLGSNNVLESSVAVALQFDRGNTRPMTYPGLNPEDYFDLISYDKGGSVLRMFENFLTTPVWKDGLNRYLTQNQFKTGTPEKLFSAFLQAAKTFDSQKLNETLQGWTRNPGYPLITVSLENTTTDGKSIYRITQEPCNLNSTNTYKWNVPLRYTTNKKREFDPTKADLHWLYPSDPSTSLLTVDTTGWVLFNVDRIGYYRVNYDRQTWLKLRDQLLSDVTAIPVVSRTQLVNDVITLAQTDHLKSDLALDILTFLKEEESESPKTAAYMAFSESRRFKDIFFDLEVIKLIKNELGEEYKMSDEYEYEDNEIDSDD